MNRRGTPVANRVHIGIFGNRNAGKSSLINALTNQEVSVVSDVKGTTTDPVYKSMELLPLGPVVIIDTPGFDDEGKLGDLRVNRAKQVLNKSDIAVVVIDAGIGADFHDRLIIDEIKNRNIPYIIVYNKSDLKVKSDLDENSILVSALSRENIDVLLERLTQLAPKEANKQIVADFLSAGDTVLLVTPTDSSAPKGRLILPQQQVIREIIDKGALAYITQPSGLRHMLDNLKTPPVLVITDSQAFKLVASVLSKDVPLTSFSVLFARFKGILFDSLKGVYALDTLTSESKVLIAEGCTHHRQCDDIGTVKIPSWIKEHIKAEPKFEFVSGGEFPQDLSGFSLVVHCGGCMLNEREVLHRMKIAKNQNVPMTNYGLLIAHTQGILKRSVEIFEIAD